MRKAFIAEALTSVRNLQAVLPDLTDAELKKAVELEEAALRRQTILDKMYRELRQRARKQFIRNPA